MIKNTAKPHKLWIFIYMCSGRAVCQMLSVSKSW